MDVLDGHFAGDSWLQVSLRMIQDTMVDPLQDITKYLYLNLHGEIK